MRISILSLLIIGCVTLGHGQELRKIELEKPDKKRGLTVMEALSERQSQREYADKPISSRDLSDLLWAAVGINRPESGKRTAPTAMNRQEIDVYVCLPEGAYLYDAKAHALLPVAKGDFRPVLAQQQAFVNAAPLCLVIVADLSLFDGNDENQKMLFGAMDAGIVSQNISLFCAAVKLATVPRAWMDRDALKKAWNLKDSQYPLLNHPVGYVK